MLFDKCFHFLVNLISHFFLPLLNECACGRMNCSKLPLFVVIRLAVIAAAASSRDRLRLLNECSRLLINFEHYKLTSVINS